MVGPPPWVFTPRETSMRPEDHRSVDATRRSKSNATSSSASDANSNAGGGVLVRLGWMVVGPTLLVVSAFAVAATPRWTFGLHDGLLALGAVLSVCLRYWDVRSFDGETANGEPATMFVFRRYAVGVAIIVGASWVAAQSIHI